MLRHLWILLFLSYLSFAHADEVIRNYKVSANLSTLDTVAKKFEIVRKLSDGFEVYVLAEHEAEFLKLAPSAQLIEKDIHAYRKELEASKSNVLAAYHKFPEVETLLSAWTKEYPNLATLEVYGKTAQGRNLYALRLSGVQKKNKPELMISAATHGDEFITVEVLLNLVGEWLEGYGKNERLTKMLDDHILYILPVTSPDGFANKTRYVSGKDPNRVFPWPGNPNNKPIDCIEAWMNFMSTHQIIGSVDLHAYGKLVMYPWGYTETPAENAADVKEMNELVNTMAQENKYEAGQISTTIYVAAGTSSDYWYWKNKTRAIAVELSTSKIPPSSKIPAVVDEAREMMWRFVEHF